MDSPLGKPSSDPSTVSSEPGLRKHGKVAGVSKVGLGIVWGRGRMGWDELLCEETAQSLWDVRDPEPASESFLGELIKTSC